MAKARFRPVFLVPTDEERTFDNRPVPAPPAEIAEADNESAGLILLWLDGYLSGVSGDTTLKWKPLERFSEALMGACAKKPNSKVLDVAKEVGIN